METIFRESTSETPEIAFNFEQGNFHLKGRSSLRYPTSFFKPFLKPLENYAHHAANVTIINIHFEFVNNASTRWIFEILKVFENIHNMGKTVLVKWFFEKESQRRLGQQFQSAVNLPFKMISMHVNSI
jgi:SiaC family regulatory phosphoprotein